MIKDYFFKLLFPKEYEDKLYYKDKIESLSLENRDLSYKIKSLEKCHMSLKDAVGRGNEILGIEANKVDQYIIVSKRYSPGYCIDINLYGPQLSKINPPRIEGKVCINKILDVNYVEIIDIKIFGNDINKGIGSIAMNYFIEEVKKLGAEKIKGTLSRFDSGHRERAIHFYKKFNFEIDRSSIVYYIK